MDRYTNYDDLLKKWHDLGLDEISKIHKVNAFNHFIKSLPTADVVKVEHGEWERQNGGFFFLCSICGKAAATKGNYCHNCGAKMDGGKGE